MPLSNNKVGDDGTAAAENVPQDGKAMVDCLVKVRCLIQVLQPPMRNSDHLFVVVVIIIDCLPRALRLSMANTQKVYRVTHSIV